MNRSPYIQKSPDSKTENKIITSRKIAWEISQGIRKTQFIGAKSYEVLKQEIFSLENRYNPQTMTNYEIYQWDKDLNSTIESVLKLPKEKRFKLYDEVDTMLKR